MQVDVFTTQQRAEFLKAQMGIDPPTPAPWEAFTTQITSTARIEDYAWMSPAPGVAEYQGHRRLANIGFTDYSVKNKEYDSSYSVLLRDIEDDKVGGYQLLPGQLAQKMQQYPGIAVLDQIANGKTRTCFDGTAFFASSHTLGTGNNLLSYNGTANGNDGLTHNAVMLIHSGMLKPLVWQNRKPATFMDDYNEKSSRFTKQVNYWSDMEGAAAYGMWWDAIYMDITDTPSAAEALDILTQFENAFRTFKLPKANSSDPDEYPHEQTILSSANCTLIVSNKLGNVFKQAVTQEWIPQTVGSSTMATTNNWYNAANVIVSARLND